MPRSLSGAVRSVPPSGIRRFFDIAAAQILRAEVPDWRVRVGATVLSVGEGNVLARARRRGDAVTLSFPPEAVLRLEDRESAP